MKQEIAGLRMARKARETGTMVGLYDGGPAGFDVEGGRWQTVCEDHGGICSHQKYSLARYFLSHPTEWCDCCMGNHTEACGHDAR